ncbi:MAG: nucleotide exchange factor GrpE [Clostridia bacterium]|nr:nucleotide exchange factor GrpE [Clostridia bacterium]
MSDQMEDVKKENPVPEQEEQIKEEAPEQKEAEEKKEEKAEEKKTSKKKKDKSAEEAEKLRAELDSVKDKLIRSLAEYDNFRKRSAKEKADAWAFSKADVIEKLLPMIDNFGRAAENDKASFEDYKKGIEMIYKQFLDIMTGLGVEAFGEKGETFDPNIHSAVMHIEDEQYGEGEIVDVFAKGYKLGEKILRPATVRVAN